jgi:hypothetical protein
MDVWGSVEGDVNAKAIISDRRAVKKAIDWVSIGIGLALLGTAIWYGTTGQPAALAVLIVVAVWAIGGQVTGELHTTHTFVMIAERRAQLLEQQVQALRGDVGDLLQLLERDRQDRRRDYD